MQTRLLTLAFGCLIAGAMLSSPVLAQEPGPDHHDAARHDDHKDHKHDKHREHKKDDHKHDDHHDDHHQ